MQNWNWQAKHRHNDPSQLPVEWYCIKRFADYKRAYAIRLQYKLDDSGKETDEVEFFIAVEYAKCEKGEYESHTKPWWREAHYGNWLFCLPALIRVTSSWNDACKAVAERHKYVSDIVGKYIPDNNDSEKDEQLSNLTAI